MDPMIALTILLSLSAIRFFKTAPASEREISIKTKSNQV
jgi:hypothetical protein